MSAEDMLQPKQLQMFMPAKQVMKEYHPHPGDMDEVEEGTGTDGHAKYRPETPDDLWERKGEESTWISHRGQNYGYADYSEGEYSLADSIEREGVKRPIPLYHGTPQLNGAERGQYVANGQHRVVSAAQFDQEVPVLHHGDATFGGAQNGIMAATRYHKADRSTEDYLYESTDPYHRPKSYSSGRAPYSHPRDYGSNSDWDLRS